MTMPLNMILVVCVIPCILSYIFYKLTILYIHVHNYISFIPMTNKFVMTFVLSIKYLSVCVGLQGRGGRVGSLRLHKVV